MPGLKGKSDLSTLMQVDPTRDPKAKSKELASRAENLMALMNKMMDYMDTCQNLIPR
jgi:hypothetical protein